MFPLSLRRYAGLLVTVCCLLGGTTAPAHADRAVQHLARKASHGRVTRLRPRHPRRHLTKKKRHRSTPTTPPAPVKDSGSAPAAAAPVSGAAPTAPAAGMTSPLAATTSSSTATTSASVPANVGTTVASPTTVSMMSPTDAPAVGAKSACIYPSEHISLLDDFSAMVGRTFNCVMVYNDAAPTWASWESPWFVHTYADMNWGTWATAPGTNRRLVITQNLFPSSENSSNWLADGASGAYEPYAVQLAKNLVAAGLGSSIIRLAHEANGTWYPDSIPDTATGNTEWIQFWRNTVFAMRSVPGANFQFDWTVNAGYRNIPLSDWYPGNDVVDIIGVDAYDSGLSSSVTTPAARWNYLYNEADGLGTVENFAVAHGKPLSIPEWGITPAGMPGAGAGGDDPTYVQGIASMVADDNVAYQSYFDSGQEGMALTNSPASLQAYRMAFAPQAAAAPLAMTDPLQTSGAPSLSVTGGPSYGATIGSTATFDFAAQSGFSAVCSLDGQPWRNCSSATSDTLQNLSAGYHFWAVQVSDANNEVRLVYRQFTVVNP